MIQRLWDRKLDHYPDTGPRLGYLGIVVLACVVLYYELYVQASVTPSIIAHYHMTFPFFVYILVIGNFVGAFGSLAAGLGDRWGRANMVAYGLFVTGMVTLFGLPMAPNMWVYGTMYAFLGVVEGIVLVATPALVRDFSPQLGRASAMGFWTMGPVLGSLIVAQVASRTLSSHPAATDWQWQFYVCGIVGLAMFVVALLFLRELSPRLRDQLMVTIHDRALVEARASGVDIEEALRHPWRQMLHLDIIGSALAISLLLFVYYTMVAFLVLYFGLFGFTEQRANSLGNWMWAGNAIALVVVGLLSDRIRVRKPLMAIGAVGLVVSSIFFAWRTYNLHTGYYTFVAILTVMAVFLGFAFAPWMAAFTETVEKRNPALIATGLSIWGWILRICVSGLFFLLPYVVTSATPLVQYAPRAQEIAATYPAQIQTLQAMDTRTAAALGANPGDQAALATAIREISTTLHATPAQALARLLALSKVPKADLAFLQAHATELNNAFATAPREWRTWWWLCIGGQVVFFPLIFLMTGRWSPRRARRDEEEHELMVEAELARLHVGSEPPTPVG